MPENHNPLWPPQPVVLEGKLVTLRPMQSSDAKAILDAASDGELWKLWFTSVPSPVTIHQYVDDALSQQASGESLPFVVIDQNQKIIGSTRYCNIESAHQRLEIGYTFYSKSVQRTGVNTETKFLLLQHAFENLAAKAVEFRTHWHNRASRKAIERLGAKQDGVLRNHRIMADGSMRDTVVYSIIDGEWPAVKRNLQSIIQ